MGNQTLNSHNPGAGGVSRQQPLRSWALPPGGCALCAMSIYKLSAVAVTSCIPNMFVCPTCLYDCAMLLWGQERRGSESACQMRYLSVGLAMAAGGAGGEGTVSTHGAAAVVAAGAPC